jgi:gas vesicle protein
MIGALIGAVSGILYAPKSGKEVRKEIRHTAEDLLEKAKEQYDETSRKIEHMVDCEKELYVGKKEKLKKAPEAGVKAFREEASHT